MFDFIARPMGQFLLFIYNTFAFHNYGLAIIFLTLFIKAILLPLNIKQYRSMSRMQEVQPQIQEIQKRYKNDKEKLNQELLKVYQEKKVNPAGGCLPVLIQLPVLYALFFVISEPLKFMLNMSPEAIHALGAPFNLADPKIPYFQIKIIEAAQNAGKNILDMSFLGLNLGLVPTWSTQLLFKNVQYIALLLIPALSFITTYFSIKFSTPTVNSNPDNQMQNSMQKSMKVMMPLMTTFFAFNVPAGLGLYWIISNIVQIFQQMYMNKFVIKKKEV